MAFCLQTLLTIALVAAVVHIYCANGAPPPPTSVELEANRQTNRFLCCVEFKKFIEMFKQQNENVGKAKKNITHKDLRDMNAYKDFLNTTAYKEFQKKEKKGINKISDKDLTNLLQQIDAMAATLVAQAEAAAGTVRLQVPYSFKVELDDGSNKTTTYFEAYLEKKLLETKNLFAKQKGNESMQKPLTEVNPQLFEKIYENFVKISTYLSVIDQYESIKALAEFLENYESTEAANDLMKVCKTKFEKNKTAKENAFPCSKGICDNLLENDAEKSGSLCSCCCCCLFMPIWCPLLCTCAAVTASVEGCQFHRLNNKQKEELITIYDQMKMHIWKMKKKEPVRGRGGRF